MNTLRGDGQSSPGKGLDRRATVRVEWPEEPGSFLGRTALAAENSEEPASFIMEHVLRSGSVWDFMERFCRLVI